MSPFAQNVFMQKIMPKFMGDGIALAIWAVMSIHADYSLIILDENHAGKFVVEWFVTNFYPVYLGNTFHPHRVPAHPGIFENCRGMGFAAAPIEPDSSCHHPNA